MIYWLLIIGMGLVGAVVLFGLAALIHYAYSEWSGKRAQRRADIVYRAESQHARWMRGDSSGFYGDYPPADL